ARLGGEQLGEGVLQELLFFRETELHRLWISRRYATRWPPHPLRRVVVEKTGGLPSLRLGQPVGADAHPAAPHPAIRLKRPGRRLAELVGLRERGVEIA